MCLCCGNWLAAGKLAGRDAVETIQYFGKRGKIFKIHVQAIITPLPHFVETFVDDCYFDYYKIIKALRQVNFNGMVLPAHIPETVGGPRVGLAYTVGYLKALIRRANEEVS
jgi:mannonate dehydratase